MTAGCRRRWAAGMVRGMSPVEKRGTSEDRGLFVAGANTEVGKTYVAALIAQSLRERGARVGVYKPVASGCPRDEAGLVVADDAVALWEAAGRTDELDRVCPQRFAAPLAPPAAAAAEGRCVDARLLRDGVAYWRARSDFVVVEGAGGAMSPISDDDLCLDLARDLGYPVLLVVDNRLGCIAAALQAWWATAAYAPTLDRVGVILNNAAPPHAADASRPGNFAELKRWLGERALAEVAWGETSLPSDARMELFGR